ncbi:MAG: YtxH domain-containing protein [Parachlamydiales bacterium]|jgi:gas vesicle protein
MAIENKEFIIGALIGSGIAAATVLLFTPRSGAKVREFVQDLVAGEINKSNNGHRSTRFAANGKKAPTSHSKSVHKKHPVKDEHHEKHIAKKAPRRKPVA